ncbi:LysR substrate-binding domain-containing protein [Achromobacter ruhlandii]|uniref:LysR substrate-binding domain-containing protein n=1 Tax=Achromobacter ruhlandii TaxID=72557 RepID=UPI0006C46871|nr:LysR substrate-binding domain-containing protein [Achromobacter ruhlandii]AVC42810.1 LysR family transcriptional regulator [Achromobacter xylosoxidans]CUI62284.1 D-malate degradation protein R [Achromobacter ruhlandii]
MHSYIHHLDDLLLFTEVVEKGGFSAAARVLNMQRSKLSRRVAELETRLGLRLLQRNTRRVSLTPMGEQIYVHALAMAREARSAFDLAAAMGDTPSGLLRMTAPSALAVTLLGELVSRFCLKHPGVRVLLDTRDQIIDLVGEGYDLAFRAQGASLTDSRLVARELAPVPLILVAAPEMARAAPRHPRELSALPLLAHATQDSPQSWHFAGPAGEAESIEFRPRCLSTNLAALREMASAGLGVALLPHYLCAGSLARGDLAQLLPAWRAAPARIYAVMPARRGAPLALRRFLDFAAAEMPALLA